MVTFNPKVACSVFLFSMLPLHFTNWKTYTVFTRLEAGGGGGGGGGASIY